MSVKRGVGVGVGAGAGVGVGVGVGVGAGVGVSLFLHIFYVMFLSFNPNCEISQFASAVYRYNIFSDVTKINKIKCGGVHLFAPP